MVVDKLGLFFLGDDQNIPGIPNHHGLSRNKVTINVIVIRSHMRKTYVFLLIPPLQFKGNYEPRGATGFHLKTTRLSVVAAQGKKIYFLPKKFLDNRVYVW